MGTEPSAPHAKVDDCWNRIGVSGDASCPELEKHVHCRNCPVYSQAAIAQLNVEIPAGYLERWTEHIAQTRAAPEDESSSCLVFRIGAEWLALPVAQVKEIAITRTIQPLPHRRDGVVLGLTSVRGELLTSISLEHLIGLEPVVERAAARHAWSARLIVVEHQGARTVFPVDEVHGIVRFQAGDLTAVPATVAKASASHIRALLPWQDQAIGVIDEWLLLRSVDRSLGTSTAI